MRRILRPKYLPLVAVIAGTLATAMRIWTIGDGPDANMLYARQPVAWNLLWALTVLVFVFSLLCLRRLKTPGQYGDNFPASPISAAGSGLAAVGIASTVPALLQVKGNAFSTVTGLLGVVAAAAMAYVAYCRFKGIKPNFLAHFSMCIFMILRIFSACRIWSNKPQLGVFVFPFLSMVCVMLAAFQLACFDADMGKRRSCLLWSLMGVYLSLAALPGSGDMIFFGGMALWLVTNLPSLRSLKTPPVAEKPTEEPDTQA